VLERLPDSMLPIHRNDEGAEEEKT